MRAAVEKTLSGGVLRSPFAHARIRRIDTTSAEAMPGVRAIVGAKDFPWADSVSQSENQDVSHDVEWYNLIATEKVYYEGQPILAIAADDEETLQAALNAVEIEYSVLPHVIDVQKAMDPEAPILHENLFTQGIRPRPSQASNIARRLEALHGDAGRELTCSEVLVAEEFSTPVIHSANMLLPFCQVVPTASGKFTVSSHRSLPQASRSLIAAMTGIPEHDISYGEGGDAGAGELFYDKQIYLEPFSLMLASKTQSAVFMGMSREDAFRATAAVPACFVTVRLGGDKSGRVTAVEIVICMQSGAFPGAPLDAVIDTLLSAYHLPSYRVIAYEVVVNRPNVSQNLETSAGGVLFALESMLDELARKLSICPLQLRSINASDVKLPKSVRQHADQKVPGYLSALKSHPHFSVDLEINQGRGLALCPGMNDQGSLSAFALHICDIEMDDDIGQVTILRYSVLLIPVDEVAYESLYSTWYKNQCQIQAAVSAGLGRALYEACLFDENGKLSNTDFLDYRLPLACDLPEVTVEMAGVENDVSHGDDSRADTQPDPISEGVTLSSVLPPLAAVANAIADATSARITSLPMSPPLVLAEMQRQKWKRRRRR